MYNVSIAVNDNIIDLSNNKLFTLQNIEGLNPVNANINSNQLTNMIGSVFNSSSVGEREITISLAINDYSNSTRMLLNNYFLPSSKCKIIIDNYSSDAYIESNDYSIFEQKIIYQISLKCLDPYFDTNIQNSVLICNYENNFEFPATFPTYGIAFGIIRSSNRTNVINKGNVRTGCVIEIIFNDDFEYGFKIENLTTNQYMGFTEAYFEKGQVIIIDTRFGNKSIYSYNSITQEIYSGLTTQLDVGSDWIELANGTNVICYSNQASAEIDLENLITVNISFSEKVSGL